MKPGVRKRQKEIEEYIPGLYFSDDNSLILDEKYLRGAIEDGLYLNKGIGMENHRPVWYQILFYLEKRQGYKKTRLLTWLQFLVENGAAPGKIDDNGLNGLELSAYDCNVELIKTLNEFLELKLEKVERCLISLSMPAQLYTSNDGEEDIVTFDEFIEIVNYLVANGHNPNEGLIAATMYRLDLIVDLLLEAGADVNYQNSSGVTALMWAYGQPATSSSWRPHDESCEIAKKLLERGADPLLKSNQRRTCRSILKSMDFWREDQVSTLEALLDKHGG